MAERYNVIRPTVARDFYEAVGAPEWAKFKIVFKKSKAGTLPGEFEGTQFYKSRAEANQALKAKQKFILESREAKKKPAVPPKKDKFLVKVGKPIKENNVLKQKFEEVIGSKNVPSTYKKTGVVKDLYKAQIVAGDKTVLSTDFGTKADATAAVEKYRKVNPIKNPPPDLKKLEKDKLTRYLKKQDRSKNILERKGYPAGGPFQGDVEVHKGHAGNIRGKQLITGDKVIRTPGVINQIMAGSDEANVSTNKFTDLDYKIENAEKEIDRIKNSNMSAAKKKKLLAVEDGKLIKYASQSDGYKVVELSDGNEFRLPGRSLQTIDPFDDFPGWTEKDIGKFLKKYKNMKVTPGMPKSEVDNIVKAGMFIENMNVSKQAGATALEEFKTMYANSPDGSALRTALDTEFKCADGCFIKVANKNPDRVSQKLIRLFRGEEPNRTGLRLSRTGMYSPKLKDRFFFDNAADARWYAQRAGTLTGNVKSVDVPEKMAKIGSKMASRRRGPSYGSEVILPKKFVGKETLNIPQTALARAVAVKDKLRWNNIRGAFETAEDTVASQADIKTWAADNPIDVKVGTKIPKPNKSVLKTVGRTLAHIGAPLPTALIDGYFINKQMDEGKSTAEIAKDPLNWLGLATMEPLSKLAGVGEKGGMNAVLRLGLNPATIRGITRFAGLPGLAISTAMTAYDQYKKYQNEEGFVYNLFNKEGT